MASKLTRPDDIEFDFNEPAPESNYPQLKKDIKRANNFFYNAGRLIENVRGLLEAEEKDREMWMFRLRTCLGMHEDESKTV